MDKRILLVDAISVRPDENDEIWKFEDAEQNKYIEFRSRAISEYLGGDISDKGVIEEKYISNYGLLMLGGLLKQNGIAVSYTNGDYFDSEDDYISELQTEYKDYDIFCFTSTTPQFNHVRRLAEAVKKMKPDAKTILGGPHTKYFLTHEKDAAFDHVVTGYGIDESVELIKKLMNDETVPSWRTDTAMYYDCPKDFSLIPEEKKAATLWYNYFEMGCPHRCKYCVEPHEYLYYSDVRSRMDEVEYAIRTCGLTMFHFCDSDFFMNEKVCGMVMDEIERRGIRCTFTVNTCPSTLIKIAEKPILKRFLDNGLVELLIGAEHFSENVRTNLSKHYDIEALQKALDIVKHKVKVPVISIFSMVGLPFEHEEDIRINVETFRQMREKDLFDYVFPKFFVPYPGSDIYENADRYGIQIISGNFDVYNRKSLSRPVKINGMDDSLYVGEIFDLIRTNRNFGQQ